MRVFQQLLQLVLSDCLVLEIKFLAPVYNRKNEMYNFSKRNVHF